MSPSSPIEVGQRVQFELVSQLPRRPTIQYRFNFGDGVISDWTTEPSITYTYTSPSHPEYTPSVQIRIDGRVRGQITGPPVEVLPQPTATLPSAARSVPMPPAPPSSLQPPRPPPPRPPRPPPPPPPPPPSPNPLPYVVGIGFVVLVVGYLLRKPKPRPMPPPIVVTFHPHSDWDAPRKSQNNVHINYELLFHPNISNGRDRLETNGPSLILRNKKQ